MPTSQTAVFEFDVRSSLPRNFFVHLQAVELNVFHLMQAYKIIGLLLIMELMLMEAVKVVQGISFLNTTKNAVWPTPSNFIA